MRRRLIREAIVILAGVAVFLAAAALWGVPGKHQDPHAASLVRRFSSPPPAVIDMEAMK